jgi:iron complex outermembrane receptor protein
MTRFSALFCAASVSVLASPAFAQPPVDTPLDSVTVTAIRNPEEPPVVADARARLSETPGAVAVVSAEALANRHAADLADALRDVPGVFAQKKWGEDVRLSIRGSGIGNNSHNRGLLLAQDGVPFNEADGFGDFQLIDTLTARYTEVWKGGNALRFGGALLGGAVNLVTPTGRTALPGEQLRVEAGSYESYRVHGELARAGSDWDVFAAATLVDAEGYRVQSAQTSARGSINVGRRLGEGRELRFYLTGGDIQQEIPGALTLSQALNTPKMALAANLPASLNSHRNMQSIRSSLQSAWRFTDNLAFTGGLYVVWKDLDHPIFQVIDQQSRNYGAFGRFDWSGEMSGRRADAFFGAWARTGDLDARQFVNLQGNHGALTAASDQNAAAQDLFAEGRLFVTDRLALTAGGTYTRAERTYINRLSAAQNNARIYDGFAPRVGLLFEAMDGAQVFANLTRSIEPPNMAALVQNTSTFNSLEAQTAWTGEIGTRGRRGDFTWDMAVYRAELDNELLTFTPGPTIPAASFNAAKTLHQGVEAALDWRFAPGWRLRQSYSYSDFRFENDPSYGGNRLPVAPRHTYRTQVRYEHHGWFVEPGLDYADGAFVDYANTTQSPAYTLFNLNAGAKLGDHARMFVDIRNLADKRYVSNVNAVVSANSATAAYWPGDGRTVTLGLTANF